MNGVFKCTAFVGYVSRVDSLLLAVNANAGAILFPRRMLTGAVSARELETYVGARLRPVTIV